MDRTLHLCNQALLRAYDRSISIVYVLFVLISFLSLALCFARAPMLLLLLAAVLFKHCSLLQSLVLQRLYLLFSTFYPLNVFVFIHFAFFRCLCSGCSICSFCFRFLCGVSFMRSLTFARCLLLMNT